MKRPCSQVAASAENRRWPGLVQQAQVHRQRQQQHRRAAAARQRQQQQGQHHATTSPARTGTAAARPRHARAPSSALQTRPWPARHKHQRQQHENPAPSGRMTQYPSRQGISTPSITHRTPAPGTSGCSSSSRTGNHSRNGVSSSHSASASLQPLHHLPQAKRHRRREQQRQRPQRQQHQCTARVGYNQRHETGSTGQSPLDAPAPKPSRPQPGTRHIQRQVDIGRHTHRQVALQSFPSPATAWPPSQWPAPRRATRVRPQRRMAPGPTTSPRAHSPTTLATTSKPVQYLGQGLARKKPRARCPDRASRKRVQAGIDHQRPVKSASGQADVLLLHAVPCAQTA
jgi:hypothetical protein